MKTSKVARIGAIALASTAFATVAAPAFASDIAPSAAPSNSAFTYSNNWLVNDSSQTVHVKAQVDVRHNLEVTAKDSSKSIKSKTVEQDLQPGETLRMTGGSGADQLFEYHLFASYPDGASADVAMYNPQTGQPWTRDGHVADDESKLGEGESHTNYVGYDHSIEVDRHWNHYWGDDSADTFMARPLMNYQGICNWDYHIR